MKKFEFSKIITLLTILIFTLYGVWSGIEYYSLAKLAIETNSIMPDSTLATTCVTTILGAVLAYCLYQWGLKNSRNKYGIDAEGQPFKQEAYFSDEGIYPEQDNFEEIDPEEVASIEDLEI